METHLCHECREKSSEIFIISAVYTCTCISIELSVEKNVLKSSLFGCFQLCRVVMMASYFKLLEWICLVP